MEEPSQKKPRLSSRLNIGKTDNDITADDNNNGSMVLKLSNMDIDDDKRASREIDEGFHSRQLACYGREAMGRLLASNVLISGMQGLGAEIAKNLILAGFKSVTLHDEGMVELWDLSSNFIFSEDDVGNNRALASLQKLQELNNAVTVSILTGTLTAELLSNFEAVVFTDIGLDEAIEFDDYCRTHQPVISFIKTEVRGLFGGVFCDFGPEFTVVDVNGEEAHTGIVAAVSNDYPALVSCADDDRLEFQDGDLVVFSEVKGMPELNDGNPRRIKNVRHDSFEIDEDTKKYGSYEGGGIATQMKEPKVLHFKSLKEELKNPGAFVLTDGAKCEHSPLLHLAFQALDKFRCEVGRFPASGSEEDAAKLISMAANINESLGIVRLIEEDIKLLRYFAFGAKAVLSPMASMFGGIVAQEVVKACTGKFNPLFQLLYFDSIESLPSEPVDPDDLKPLNGRYDAQISVFGSKFQRTLEKSKLFMVGVGGLGCELLKNLALMGVGCDTEGRLIVTDDDLIERNNLSRQFLFRDADIGKAKSVVAATAVAKVNPCLNIEALEMRACPETENVFNDAFWENLDYVLNALDSVSSRRYMDKRCVYFQKPLLESGTLGAKCNTQVVVPHLTENYGALRENPFEELEQERDQAPSLCTIRYYPYKIHHCLTWALSEFEVLFEKAPTEVNAYLSNRRGYTSSKVKKLGDWYAKEDFKRILDCLTVEKCESFEDCIVWARLKFEDYFANFVKQLTYTYPEKSVTKLPVGADSSLGLPVWLAPKRFPCAIEFRLDDLSHLDFIKAASVLRAKTYGVSIPKWSKNSSNWGDAVSRVVVPAFEPRAVRIPAYDDGNSMLPEDAVENTTSVSDLTKKLGCCSKKLPHGFSMTPIQFNKDNDEHIEMVAALANLRARNYKIAQVEKLKAKIIAGKIIPTISTSTAVATGLVCLELYKVVDKGHKQLQDYRNSCINLALPLYTMFQPVAPKVFKHQDLTWTLWDRWTLKGNPTLRGVFDWLREKGLKPTSAVCNLGLVFDQDYYNRKSILDQKIGLLARKYGVAPIPCYRHHADVDVGCESEQCKLVEIPTLSVYFDE